MDKTAKIYGYQILTDSPTLFKRCSKDKHFMRVPPGIAIDEDIFNEAIEEGVKYIQIFEREEKTYYSATAEKFKKKAIFIDRGHGRQLALPLDYWILSKDKEIPRELTIERQPLPLLFPIKNTSKVEQGFLFEGDNGR